MAWSFVRGQAHISEEEQQITNRLRVSTPARAKSYLLSQAFLTLMRTHDEASLDDWLIQAAAAGMRERQSFAQGMRRAAAAVRAAITRPWSNGHVEGHVNRLKLIKRMGDGRANVDLLRHRVLAA